MISFVRYEFTRLGIKKGSFRRSHPTSTVSNNKTMRKKTKDILYTQSQLECFEFYARVHMFLCGGSRLSSETPPPYLRGPEEWFIKITFSCHYATPMLGFTLIGVSLHSYGTRTAVLANNIETTGNRE